MPRSSTLPLSSVLALLLLACGARPAQAQWTQTSGPLGGTLHHLAATDGALLGSPGGPLFRYDGAAWSVTEGLQTGEVLASGSDVYASDGADLVYSGDGGLTFAPVGPEARHARLLNLEGPRVWASAPTQDTLFVSADDGATWDAYVETAWVTSFGQTFEVPLVNAVGAVRESDTVLAAGMAYIFSGIYRLAPSDTSWVRVLDLGDQNRVWSFVRHGAALFVGSTVGVHTSTDGGATWTEASAGLPPQGGAAFLFPGTTALYARVGPDFFTWTGVEWTPLPPFPTYPIAVTAGDRLFASAADGVYALVGQTWTRLPRLLASSPLLVYAAGPTALARSGAELTRTDDTGATWTTLTPISGQVYTEDGDFLLAVTPSGLRRSSDGGQTWAAAGTIVLPPDWTALSPNGFAGHNEAVYAAYGASRYGKHGVLLGQYGGVFRSDDGGASWAEVSTGLPTGSFGHSPVRFIAEGGERLFAQTEHGCTTSTGTTWTHAQCPPGSLAAFVTAPGRWLALTSHGVYGSTTLGATWTALTDGLPVGPGPSLFWYAARVASVDDTPLFVGEDDGTTQAYRLDGTAWTPLALPFPDGVRWMSFAGGDGRLYGGAYNRGAWTTPLSLSTVAVTASPVTPPVTIPAEGGSFAFSVTLTNTSAAPVTVEVWTEVAGPVARNPVLGPRTVTLPAGATVTRTLTQQVPGNAPPGLYTYTLNAGTFPDAVGASDAFTFTKAGTARTAHTAGSEDGWAVSGWDEAAAASAAAADALTLGLPVPNPTRDRVTLSFTLGSAADVRLAVYDVLGREVAVLVDETREAGTHAVALDARSLAAGTYAYRLQAGDEVRTGRLTLVR